MVENLWKRKRRRNQRIVCPTFHPSQMQGLNARILDVVYSQPADTGTGNNVNTQLVYAVAHLKVRRCSSIGRATDLKCTNRTEYPKPHATRGYRNCHEHSSDYRPGPA